MRDWEDELVVLQRRVEESVLRAAEAKAAAEKELEDYQHERDSELVHVQEKIDTILRRKRDLQVSLKTQLTSLQGLTRAKEGELERHRVLAYT
jgi:hypothetical protein